MPALRCSLLLAATSLPSLAMAQQAPEQVIVVTAPRSLPAPVRDLGREDIDSYGAGSIGELLDEVLAEEGEEAPVVLINGRRASGLEELSDYPPEALDRVEVLPSGSGAEVGASPTRKVVNLVLARRFDGRIGRAALRAATDGGWSAGRGEGTYTRIRGPSRLNLSLRGRLEGALTEAERDIPQPPESLLGEGAARTLVPAVQASELSLSAATRLGPEVDLSGSGRLSYSSRNGRQGLSTTGERLDQNSRLLGGRVNATLNAETGGWTLALLGTLDADRRRVEMELDTESARSLIRSLTTTLDFSAVRPLFDLPAGPLQLTLGTGFSSDQFRTEVRRSGAPTPDRFTERAWSATAGLLLPIAGGPDRILEPLGEFNLSLDAGVTRVEDAGTFSTGSLGVVWQPRPWARLTGAVSRGSSPPSARFRREPVLLTSGVLVVDPLTGQSVRVTEIAGPLAARDRARNRQERLGVTLSPRSAVDLRLESEWSRRQDRNVAGELPLASGAVLAAFPERFVRNADGLLTAVDVSPLLFARRRESQLRNALSLRVFLAPAAERPTSAGDEDAGGDEPPPRGGRPRLQLSLAHTLLLSSDLTLRDGLAPIDLLSRDALLLAGGRPRHQLDFSANLSRPGMGLRLAASYRSSSRTALGSGAGEPRELRFGALGTLSLRAFTEADRLFGRSLLTRGTRLSLNVVNLTNARERVRDGDGNTPLAYQPAFRDALGRTVEFEIRRRF